MGAETSVGGMIVEYRADISGLASAIMKAKTEMTSMDDSASSSTSALKGMFDGLANSFRQLQNPINTGGVTGLTELDNELSMVDRDAQKARTSLQGVQEPVSESSPTHTGFLAGLNSMTSGIGNFITGGVSGFVSGIGSMASGMMNFVSQAGITIFSFQQLGQTAMSFANALLQPNASMEQTTVAFETLLGSGKKTQDFLQQMKDFAAATPFTFPEVATAAQHMLAFGFASKDVIPYLTNIGDAMGSMGKGSANIDHIVTVFGQMHAAGKLNAGDMMQIVSEGIPAWKFLADAMGKTVPEVQKLSSQGLIPADAAIKAVSEGMHNMFGGGMAAQANTFNGLLSTFQDNIGAAMRAFTGPLFDLAKQGLIQLGNLVSGKQFQDFATVMGQQVGNALNAVVTFITSNVVPAFQALYKYVNGDQIQGFIADIQTVGNQLSILLAPAVQKVGSLFSAVFSAIGPILTGTVIPALDSVVFQVGLFLEAINTGDARLSPFAGLLFQIGNYLQGVFAPVWQTLVNIFQSQLKPAWDSLLERLQSFLPVLQDAWAWLQQKFGAALSFVAGVVQSTLLPALGRFSDWIMSTGVPAILTLWQWHVQLQEKINEVAAVVRGAFFDALQVAWNWLKSNFVPILQTTVDWLSNVAGNIIAFASQAQSSFGAIGSALQGVWNYLEPIFYALAAGLYIIGLTAYETALQVQAQLAPAFAEMGPLFSQLWDAMQPLLPVIQGLAIGLIGLATGAMVIAIKFTGDLVKAFGGILIGITFMVTGIVQIFTGLGTSLQGISNFICDFLTGRFDHLNMDVKKIMDGLVSMTTGAWNLLAGTTIAILSALFGTNMPVQLESMVRQWNAATNQINITMKKFGDNVTTGFSIMFTNLLINNDKFFNELSKIWDAILASLGIHQKPIYDAITKPFGDAVPFVGASTQKITGSAHAMESSVLAATGNMKTTAISDFTIMSDSASQKFAQFTGNATTDLMNLDASTKQYMNDVASYIDNQSALAAQHANDNFNKIHHLGNIGNLNSSDGSSTDTGSILPGHASGILDSPLGHWAMVGEHGPEPMYVPKGASILPNGQYPIKPSATAVAASVAPASSLQGNGGGGSNTYIFEMDGMELARMVGNNTDKLVRLRLGPRSIRAV